FRHIESRWNRGQFGKDWEECDDTDTRRNWDRRTGLGRGKIFEVRALYNDLTMIDEFLTPEFVEEQKLYSFGYTKTNERREVESRQFHAVKENLLSALTNCGNPLMYVEDGNYRNRGELLLTHDHQGIDLRMDWAREVLRSLERIWRRPVEVHTALEGKATAL